MEGIETPVLIKYVDDMRKSSPDTINQYFSRCRRDFLYPSVSAKGISRLRFLTVHTGSRYGAGHGLMRKGNPMTPLQTRPIY
jgi:hypothetical protein